MNISFKIFIIALLVFISNSLSFLHSQSMQIYEDCGNPYPYTHKKISLYKGDQSIKVSLLDIGKGDKTLVFIHGLGSYAPAWKKNIDVLKNHYRCVAIDLPGYGHSNIGDFPYSMDWFAEIVSDVIFELELENVTIIGHSMGGQIAMKMALNHSDVFNDLILVAPAGFEEFTSEERTFFEKNVTSEVIKNTTAQRTEFNFKINFVEFPDDAKFMLEDRLALEKKNYFKKYCDMIPKCVMSMLDQPVWQDLGKIDKRTLIFYGKNEMLIPNKFLHPDMKVEDIAEFGKKNIKNSQLVMVPNSGHFVQWEGAEIVNQEIINFLENK